jgi:hypothetical protein
MSYNKPTAGATTWREIFGRQSVLEDSDVATFDELSGRFYAAIKPADAIEEMLLVDAVCLEWEVLLWRRYKSSVLKNLRITAVENFLNGRLGYHLYRKDFEKELGEVLRKHLEKGQTIEDALKLARDCANKSPEAVLAVVEILNRISLTHIQGKMDSILDDAHAAKAAELAEDYRRRRPSAVKLVERLLAKAALKIDDLVVEELESKLELIERIDRIITIAESRRNTNLREIDRHRATLGEAVRRSMLEIEQDEVKAIEMTPTEGKDAA